MTTQPAIDDVDRTITYPGVNSAGPFTVPFPLFDGTGADLAVTLDGAPVSGWTFAGSQVEGFYGAPYTWVDGAISFTAPIAGDLRIDGDRAPRRVSQYQEGRGVPARDQNAELNTLTAIAREQRLRVKRQAEAMAALEGAFDGAVETVAEAAAQSALSAEASAAAAGAAAGAAGSASSSAGAATSALGAAVAAAEAAGEARDEAASLLSTKYDKAGGVITGEQTIRGGVNSVTDLDKTTGVALLRGSKYGVPQWSVLPGDIADDFAIYRHDDAGEAVSIPFHIDADTDDVAIPGLLGFSPAVTRAQITSTRIRVDSFVVSGEAAVGDRGAGARYVRGTSGGLRAIQDATGAWFNLVPGSPVNVCHFGAMGFGVAAVDGPAFIAAITYLKSAGGGTLFIPRGQYRVTQTIDLTSADPEVFGLLAINIVGEGRHNTAIIGDQLPSGHPVINVYGHVIEFGLSGFSVLYGVSNGIVIVGTYVNNAPYHVAQGSLKDLYIFGCGGYGVYSRHAFMIDLKNVWSRDNGTGFGFVGNHTTLEFSKCWADGNTNAGYEFNGVVYSTMAACGSDGNEWGYVFLNCSGIVLNGCGAESNRRSSVVLTAANSSTTGIVPEYQNISAFTINGGYWLWGNMAGADAAFPNFIEANAYDSGGTIDVCLNGNRSIKNPAHATDHAITGIAVAGATIRFRGTSNAFDSSNAFSGAGTAEFIGT